MHARPTVSNPSSKQDHQATNEHLTRCEQRTKSGEAKKTMLNSRCEKTFVVILFGIASNQRDIAARVVANRFEERVYSIKESITGPVETTMSRRDLEMAM